MYYDFLDFCSDTWGKFIVCLFLIICLLGAYLLYNEGIILPPTMPINTQELSTWSNNDLTKLHKAERCNELSEFYAGEVEGAEALMKRCKIISKWWLSYDDRQEAKHLKALAEELRRYSRENLVD